MPRQTANKEIIERQNEIIAQLHRIETILASRAHYDEIVQDLQKTVVGNGKPGLSQRTAILEEREQKRDRREWFIQSAVIAQIIITLALVIFK